MWNPLPHIPTFNLTNKTKSLAATFLCKGRSEAKVQLDFSVDFCCAEMRLGVNWLRQGNRFLYVRRKAVVTFQTATKT